MKFTILIPISLLISGCSIKAQIKAENIQIARTAQHPFLEDHCKQLLIFGENEKVVDSMEIYCDPGSGCNSYLFDTDSTYTLIDCNGSWYEVNKSTRKIVTNSWKWQSALPAKYIGTYIRSNQIFYSLEKEISLDMGEVYKFKDPGE